MKVRTVVILTAVFLSANLAQAVEFDCIELPANPASRPPDCDLNPDPSGWCSCLKSGLTSIQGESLAAIEQAIIYVYQEPTIGKYTLTVNYGTLDLSGIGETDSIGNMVIDAPSGQAENFYILFEMIVTRVDVDTVDFDVTITDTNPTSIGILDYDPPGVGSPLDANHANGLTYRGSLLSFGPDLGFEMTFEYISDPGTLPPPATSTGIEVGDLQSPNFSVPVLLTFPTIDIYTLPTNGPLEVTTVMSALNDPLRERTFIESFDLIPVTPKEKFRRGDVNGDGTVDLSDPIYELGFLFLGGPDTGCKDAADANDDGAIDISDPVSSLSYQFQGGTMPLPGALQCGPDDKTDTLPACDDKNCK